MLGKVALVAVGDTYPNLAVVKAVQSNPEAKKRLEADFASWASEPADAGVSGLYA